MKYINRHIRNKFQTYLDTFPVTILTGARQSGKSTFLTHNCDGRKWQYISLDQRNVLERIERDPDFFIEHIGDYVIIDEAQKVPAVFNAVKWLVDRKKNVKIVLSGSANFLLLKQVGETLAGRAGILELYPFTARERLEVPNLLLHVIDNAGSLREFLDGIKQINMIPFDDVIEHIMWGGYPKVYEFADVKKRQLWLENYRTTYIERDLRDLPQVANITDFQRLHTLVAHQSASLLNYSTLAGELGITVPTVKRYVQILIASYQCSLLEPYYINIRKRLIKSPKIFLADTGMAHYLMGYGGKENLLNSGAFGKGVESHIVSEFIKARSYSMSRSALYFWRTVNKSEIDLIIETNKTIVPIEIKSSKRIPQISLRGIKEFMCVKTKKKIPFAIVFYAGDEVYIVDDKIVAVPLGYV